MGLWSTQIAVKRLEFIDDAFNGASNRHGPLNTPCGLRGRRVTQHIDYFIADVT